MMRGGTARLVAAILALSVTFVTYVTMGSAAAGDTGTRPGGAPALTNLAHLDYLGDSVAPPEQAGHSTYRLAEEPSVGVLWTYAEPGADGELRRVGGGPFDPATGTYSQGAFNADDVARASVVYLRHWRLTGDTTSRHRAYQLLRGLTYLQTSSGPDAGNVVLWMQPDGTLNPSPTPVELPDPSDSGPSYWLARTLWALGEGYEAFEGVDPAFAAFLAERFDLSRAALDRQVLLRYGEYQQVDGERWPAWLVADGADASAEAVLGLSAYVSATGDAAAQRSLSQLADGIAEMSTGDRRTWPFGAVMPWAQSRSVWHAWGGLAPAALAEAGTTLHRPRLVSPAVADSATFTPWLLTSGGPDNGRLPTSIDRSQIAYGADSRVQSLLATADATGSRGFEELAGIAAAWFFGANAAGVPAYDPATGRTVDGIAADGTVNTNSGAESTIHGLLTMLALDARPRVADAAMTAHVVSRTGTVTVEAEIGTLSGGAAVVTPASLWTGESQYGGSGYVTVPDGATVTLAVTPLDQDALVLPVVDLQPGSAARTRWSGDDRRLGAVRHGDVGPQGITAAPGALLPVTLPRQLRAGSTVVTATGTAGIGADVARVDAVLVEPLVSDLVLGGRDAGTVLVRSAASGRESATVAVPGSGPVTVRVYDDRGRLRETVRPGDGRSTVVPVLGGGFSIARR